jgi:hypothetical protein
MMNVRRLGQWSAIMTAALAVAFFGVGIFGTSSFTGAIVYPYVFSTINPIDYTVWVPGFLLAPAFVVLMACIHDRAPKEKKIFSQIGLSFALIYAALIMTDFFLQWTVVLPSIMKGETEGLSLFSMYNPRGIFIAVESLAYLMMNTALLAVASVFTGRDKLERCIRWLFVIGFFLAIGSFLIISAAGQPIVTFEVTIISINVVLLILAGIWLRKYFWRMERTT